VTIAIIAVCTLVQIYAAQFAPSHDDVEQQIQARMRDLLSAADPAQLAAVGHDIERIATYLPDGHHLT